jgi:hypothetical protein
MGGGFPMMLACPKKIKKPNTNKEAKQIKGKRAGAVFIDCSYLRSKREV